MLKSFSWSGLDRAETPVILSVPHAGRDYPTELEQLSRLNLGQLRSLEDRYADRLAEASAAAGYSVLTAHTARAWIDLNRAEHDLDPAMVEPGAAAHPYRMSAKARGGLGLIPRRIAQGGDIWRGPITNADLQERLASVHRPYHAAISGALTARLNRFGCAILLDLHSMPPIRASRSVDPAHIVVGDLYGRSAHPRFTDCAVGEAREAGFRTSLNSPYAGGHILDHHARPHRGVHALQLEIDRSLYLDAAMDKPAPGAAAISQLVLRIADALATEARDSALPIAAE